MTTTVTKSIGSAAGRDFATIAAWTTYVNGRGDITAAGVDEVHIGELYNDSVFVESTLTMPFSGTRDATHTATLRCATGQGFNANASRLTNALRYNEANGVAVQLTSTASQAVAIGTFCIVDGVQILSTAAHTVSFIGLGAGTIQNCIIDLGTLTTSTTSVVAQGSSGTAGYIGNSLFVWATAGRTLYTSTTTAAPVFEGNTFVNTTGSSTNCVLNNSVGRAVFRNNVAIGYVGRNMFSGNPGVTATTNATDGTLQLGTGSSGITAANEFQSPTSPLDLRMKSTSTLRGAGTTSATLTLDILKQTRASPPAIGAHEYVGASAPAPAPLPRRHSRIPFGLLN